MEAKEFCFWLKGWLDSKNPETIQNLQEIKDKLDLVLNPKSEMLSFQESKPEQFYCHGIDITPDCSLVEPSNRMITC
jgi:hypothetical protein